MKKATLNLPALLLILMLCGLGCKFGSVQSSETEKPVSNSAAENTAKPVRKAETETVPAKEIVEAFRNKDAKRLYRGKTVNIRGRITNINDVFGMSNINLRDSEAETGLVCYLKKPADRNKLKIGDEVVIRAAIEDTDFGVVSEGEILKIN